MSPDKRITDRRVVILPLPVWLAWRVVSILAWACRSMRSLFTSESSRWKDHGPTRAAHHRDVDCAWIAERLYEHLNDYRGRQGLRPVAWNEQLEVSSLYQSQRMEETGEFAHELSDGVTLTDRIKRAGYGYAACGENLFWLHDPRKDGSALAWAMHEGWVHSPGHQANLVGDWEEVGIGVVRDGEGGFYATQNFGMPRGPFAPFLASPPPPRRARRA